MTPEERRAAQLKLARDMVTFWASFIDVQLQDYLKAVEAGNLVKTGSAAARVVQVAMDISDYFKEGIKPILSEPQMVELCRSVTGVVHSVAEKKVSEFYLRSQALTDEYDIMKQVLQ